MAHCRNCPGSVGAPGAGARPIGHRRAVRLNGMADAAFARTDARALIRVALSPGVAGSAAIAGARRVGLSRIDV